MRVALLALLASSLLSAQDPSPAGGEMPVLVSFVAPPYPRAAKVARIMGTTVTAIAVTSEGRVADAKTVSGIPLLANHALSALRQWQFQPSRAAHNLNVRVEFELLDDCSEGTDKHPITPETYVSAELPPVVHVKTAVQCVETSNSKQRH
jgi:TonB family protein